MRYAILIYDETTADPTGAPPPDPEVWDQVMADYNAYSEMLRSNGRLPKVRRGWSLSPPAFFPAPGR